MRTFVIITIGLVLIGAAYWKYTELEKKRKLNESNTETISEEDKPDDTDGLEAPEITKPIDYIPIVWNLDGLDTPKITKPIDYKPIVWNI